MRVTATNKIKRLPGMINPVTDMQQLQQYAKLGRTEFERSMPESDYKINENVHTESKKEVPNGAPKEAPNGAPREKYLEMSLYDNKARIHHQGQHIGVNIDKTT